jgi:hypothetical protein
MRWPASLPRIFSSTGDRARPPQADSGFAAVTGRRQPTVTADVQQRSSSATTNAPDGVVEGVRSASKTAGSFIPDDDTTDDRGGHFMSETASLAEHRQREADASGDGEHGADLPGSEGEGSEGSTGAEGAAAASGEGDGDDAVEPAFPTPELLGEGQLTLNVGGEKPDTSEVKMRGTSIEVPNKGQFSKGQFVDVVVRCRVAEVHMVDKFDNATGTVVGTVRRHIMKPLKVERVD